MRSNRIMLRWLPAALVLGQTLILAGCALSTFRSVPNDCIPINALPFNAKTSGRYCLVQDLTLYDAVTTPVAILLSGNNIVLDLNGYTLRGPGGGFGIFAVNAQYLTVKNGTLKNFSVAIAFGVLKEEPIPKGNVIESLVLENNSTAGIYIVGSDSMIQNNKIENTGGGTKAIDSFRPVGMAVAMRLTGPGTKVLNNTINNTYTTDLKVLAYAIELLDAQDSEVRGNTVTGNGRGLGISLPDATQIIVADNTINNVARAISLHRTNREPLDPARRANGVLIKRNNSFDENKPSK